MKNYLVATCLIWIAIAVSGCPENSRMPYQKGMGLMQGGNYGGALEQFEKALAVDSTQRMPMFGKARCLYELGKFAESLECFERFISDTEDDRSQFRDERYDAEFYRDKCKLELGMEVPQNERAIPEERMRY